MTQQVTEAVLLAVRDWGDADRIVTLFSKDYGKMRAIAYGARRPKSPLAGSVQTFSYVNVVLYPGKNISTIKQCLVMESFQSLREDLLLTAYGAFMTELTAELWPECQVEPTAFIVLLSALRLLALRNPRIVAMAAAWQLLAIAGFCPVITECVECGATEFTPQGFKASAGGVVCEACCHDLPECTTEDVTFLSELLQMDLVCPAHFTVSGAALMHCEKFLLEFLAYHLDKKLNSLSFISSITRG